MDEKELKALFRKGETEITELKKSTAQMERALVSTCALLNHKGGTIYFGVYEGKIIGQEVSDSTLRSISQKIGQRIKPQISPEVKVLELEGKSVIEVRIKEGNNKPYYLDGIAYKRVGSENVVIPPDEIERIILEKKKGHWDEQICEGAKLEDIDEEKVKWFLRNAKAERNLDIDEKIPTKDALEKLELIKDGKPTNAAILLFGKNPQRFFLQAQVRCAKFKGTEAAKPFLDMRVLKGTLFEQIDAGERFVLDNIKKEAWVEPGKIERQEKWEYPPDAIREAITNAICHRNYEHVSNVHVSIFDDRVEIWNPGKLPKPLKPEDLKVSHKSVPVNRLVAEVLFLVKYIERWGSGTLDIMKWCTGHGLPEPLFKEEQDGFSVVLRKYKVSEDMLKTLNERQRKAIYYLRTQGKITNKEYMQLNPSITVRTAFNDLDSMVKKGLLKAAGERKSRYYTLA